MMFRYFGFHYVTCSQPLHLPCACGTFKKPVSSIGSVRSLVCHQTQIYHIFPIRQLWITDKAELDPKIIRGIVNMGIKGYSQLIDIVNFYGKQDNISSSKKHMALIFFQWSNDLGLITRSNNNFCLP